MLCTSEQDRYIDRPVLMWSDEDAAEVDDLLVFAEQRN
jgi:hypothetical protein